MTFPRGTSALSALALVLIPVSTYLNAGDRHLPAVPSSFLASQYRPFYPGTGPPLVATRTLYNYPSSLFKLILGLSDISTSRTLAGTFMSSDSLTVESCITFCSSSGYIYAGVEFGRKIFPLPSIVHSLLKGSPQG